VIGPSAEMARDNAAPISELEEHTIIYKRQAKPFDRKHTMQL